MDKQYISISESEWRVMKVLWAQSPKTLPQIIDALRDASWSTTTIQTYLARLVKKGALRTRRQGKGYLYSPAISEEKCQIEEGKTFLKRVFDGSLASMVSNFVKSGNLSDEELKKLKSFIEGQSKKDADNR